MSRISDRIRQTEVQLSTFDINADTQPLKEWFQRPLKLGQSLDSILRDTPAERMFDEGLRYVTESYISVPCLRPVVFKYWQFCNALPREQQKKADFELPIWLLWMQGTVQALSVWRQIETDQPILNSSESALLSHWRQGMSAITSGYSGYANSLWADFSRSEQERSKKESKEFLASVSEWKRISDLAAEFSLSAPICDAAQVGTVEISAAIESWRSTVFKMHLDAIFWQAHLPFLNMTRFRTTSSESLKEALTYLLRFQNPLTRSLKSRLTHLINTGNRCEHPDCQISLALCRVYQDIFDEHNHLLAVITNDHPA